jgi:5-methylcytosine-specific restriction endonuclease McrA
MKYLEIHSPEARIERREKREEAKKKSKLITRQPKKSPKRTRYISRAVKDKVFQRDNGQCTFVSRSGVRCECKDHLQIDHVVPFAKGGGNEATNLRLLCPAHNALEADKEFGRDWMENKRMKDAGALHLPPALAVEKFQAPKRDNVELLAPNPFGPFAHYGRN